MTGTLSDCELQQDDDDDDDDIDDDNDLVQYSHLWKGQY